MLFLGLPVRTAFLISSSPSFSGEIYCTLFVQNFLQPAIHLQYICHLFIIRHTSAFCLPRTQIYCTLYSTYQTVLQVQYAKQHGDCTALLIKENNTKVLYLILNCIVIAKHLFNNTPVIRQSRCWTEWLFIIIIIIKKMYLL